MAQEEFRNDSDVHISKLSDREFQNKKGHLTAVLGSLRNKFEMDQYFAVLEKRSQLVVPLSNPVNLQHIYNTDFLAIVSKMHSRAFVRSMRLNRNINQLICKNLANFSIRISRGSLRFVRLRYDTDDTEIVFARETPFLGDYSSTLKDLTSILPFSFTTNSWDGKALRGLLNQMKWPFTNLVFEWKVYVKAASIAGNVGVVKPWMLGSSSCGWYSFKDWEMARVLNMKQVSIYSFNAEPGDLESLLDSFEYVYVDRLRESALPQLVQVVQSWKSGDWNHKATEFHGHMYTPPTVFKSAILGLGTFDHFSSIYYTTILIQSPDKTFLVIIRSPSLYNSCSFLMLPNIRTLNDLVSFTKLDDGRVMDFSGYNGDPDAELDPKAYCDLLRAYYQ